MASEVEIASLALSRLGHSKIASFSATGSKAERWFHANYETNKRALLAEHPWNFAIKRVALVAAAAPTNEYTNAYTLPTDFIRLVRLNGDSKAGYRVERNTLATYEATAVIEYVYDVTDEATFSAPFTDLLAQRLAAEIAFYITANGNLTEQAWNLYRAKLTSAKSIDSRESAPRYRSANMALARLGETTRQGDDGAHTLESAARIIEANYDTVRKSLLREYPWNFAVKRVALVSTSAPVNDYSNRFTLPADFLRMVKLNASTEVTYRIEGGYLVTDASTATIEYIWNVTDEDAFSPDFLDVLAQRHAAEAAAAISPQVSQGMWNLYQAKLAQAKATDARESSPRKKAVALAVLKLGEVAGRGGEDAAIAREHANRVAEALWDSCRKALLREHAWNFAVKRTTLSSGGAASGEYSFTHSLPTDFVRAVRINNAEDAYRIEGATILSNLSSYVLEYVYDLTDETKFDPLFQEVLAQRIAAEASVSLNPGAASAMWTVYQQKLAGARSVDGREAKPLKKACALALIKLGDVAGRQGDDALAARESAARTVEGLWDSCRKALLREHIWNFATKQAVLVNVSGTAYTLPADFIRAIRVNSSESEAFLIQGPNLFTSATAPFLEYIYDLTDETKFDAQFAEVLAQRIAAEAAASISPGAAGALWTVYQQKLQAAIISDTTEAKPAGIVANLAMSRLGEVAGRGGADLLLTREAVKRSLDSNMPVVRKALLREHPWNFAIRRTVLTRDTIRTITAITAANPVVVTSAGHDFANGDVVYLDGILGMTELNGRVFTVAGQTTDTFQLSGENGTAYAAYSSGGSAYGYVAKEFQYRFALPTDCLRMVRINGCEADEYRLEGGYVCTNEATVYLEYITDVGETEYDSSFVDVFATRLAAEMAVALNPGAAGALWASYEAKMLQARTNNAREGTPRGLDADIWLNARA